MSRLGTQQTAQPTQQGQLSYEKIAQRAYDKWLKRGRPQGSDQQDWLEAEAELRAELARTAGRR